VAGAEVDHAAAAKEPADATRHLPRLVQLFAGKATGLADGSADAVEERGAGKSIEIVFGETRA